MQGTHALTDGGVFAAIAVVAATLLLISFDRPIRLAWRRLRRRLNRVRG
jgi:hypothetical protein